MQFLYRRRNHLLAVVGHSKNVPADRTLHGFLSLSLFPFPQSIYRAVFPIRLGRLFLHFVFFLAFCSTTYSAIGQSIFSSRKKHTVEVTGYGDTEAEARLDAEVKAIVSTIGSFVTRQTEIVDDELISDKISEIAAGTISRLDIIRPFDGKSMTVKVQVSVTEVMKFCKNNGIGTDINGAAFAGEFNRQGRNESAEQTALSALSSKLNSILEKCFDFRVIAAEPTIDPYGSSSQSTKIPLLVEAYSNANIKIAYREIIQTLRGISMTQSEVDTYKKMGKEVFPLSVYSEDDIKRHYTGWNMRQPRFPPQTSSNTFYLRRDPRNLFNSIFSKGTVESLNKQFQVRFVGTEESISASSFESINMLMKDNKKYDVNSYAPYMYMSEIRRSPLDRIRYYSEDEVLVLPSREGVLTGVFKYDYKTDVNRVGRYKRVEVIPTR